MTFVFGFLIGGAVGVTVMALLNFARENIDEYAPTEPAACPPCTQRCRQGRDCPAREVQ